MPLEGRSKTKGKTVFESQVLFLVWLKKKIRFFEFSHLLAVVSEFSFVFSISVLVLVEVLANCRLLLFGESFGQVILA